MSPEEDRTRDVVDSEPKHYQLSYSGPPGSISKYSLQLHHAFPPCVQTDLHKPRIWIPMRHQFLDYP